MNQAQIRDLRVAVSYHCNLSCEHCYVPEENRKEYSKRLEADELDVDEIRDFTTQLARDYGLQRLSVTGGEALLNIVWPRTRAVVEHGLGLGLEVRLNTSGSGQVAMTELAAVAAAHQRGSLLLQLSLDGIDADKVNKFRGHRMAMRWALDSLTGAIAAGLRVQIRYTATVDNFADTLPCYELAEEVGVETFLVKPMFPVGVARDHREILLDAERQIGQLQHDLVAASVGKRTVLELPEPVLIAPSSLPAGANTRIAEGCLCAVESLYVSTNGDIYPCNYMVGEDTGDQADYILGNITDQAFTFDTAWARPDKPVWERFRAGRGCGTCVGQQIAIEQLGSPKAPEVVTVTLRGAVAHQ